MKVKNKKGIFKNNSSASLLRSWQARLLFTSVLVFCLVLIAVLSQEENLSGATILNKENPAYTPASTKTARLAEDGESRQAGQGGETGAANKFGFADFLTIYHSYYQTKIEDERLKEKGIELQGKINADRNKVSELGEKMSSGILSEKEKENLNKEVGELKTQITKNIQEFNLKIDSDRKQVIDKLIEDLRSKISNYGKEKGYIMIFDKNELIFSDTRFDLTQEIVDYINKNDK